MKRLAAAALGVLLLAASTGTPARKVLDAFDGGTAGWIAAPSEGVRMALAPDSGALRMDFDFQGRAGWAAARKAFPMTLPDNWAIRFRFRGEGPPQTLEFKLLDVGGENVWWSVRREFTFPTDWTTLTVRKRQVSFAWGPAGPRELRELGSIEITVVNAGGGRGSVWIDDLVLEELPPPGAPLPSRKNWRSPPAADDSAELVLDLGGRRELGGLALLWDAADFATRYDIELSDDGQAWSRPRSVSSPRGGRVRIYLPDTEAAFLRLRLHQSSRGRGYVLQEISVQPPESAETPTKFLETLAREAPPGHWPRSFIGEQIYWTLVGTDGGGRENGLLSEDGALETGPAAFSLEPYLRSGDALLGWREASASHRLEDDELPIPSVQRRYPGGAALNVTAFADGPPEASTLRVRYRVANSGSTVLRTTLYLALRPMQVNPPSQFLNVPGGFSPIRTVTWDGRAAEVNGTRRVVPLSPPAAFGASTLDEGEIVARLSEGDLPETARANDADGFASAAFAWDLEIPAGGSRDVVVAVPMAGVPLPDRAASPAEGADFQARLDATARAWRDRLGRVTFALPAAARDIGHTARANLAWILVNRDGPAIRPGSRAYARSWIRDGSLTSVALLRLGHFAEARDFLRWFAPFQYENGAVPCCVDRRGADPVPEHDSHGELLYLAAEYFAYTGDRATVEEVWPRLAKAAAHIDALRAQRRTPEYQSGEKRFFFGLLPESISHEGYSAKAVHSYWDDLWAVRGLTGASELAWALGKTADAARIAASRDEMRRDLHASIRAVIEARRLDFIPGSADLGDLDPTSTTIAFEPCNEAARLPQAELASTFEKYWTSFVSRRANRRKAPAGNYTPYEWRVAGTYVRLGRRDRAEALFEFFFGDRRPPGWKHWAEGVGAEPRAPQFIGDMPHGWVGSDFLRSFLDLFVYDREEDGALVLGAGLPAAWLADPRGVSIGKVRTRYGPLDLAMSADASAVRVRIAGGLTVPPGGFVVPWPREGRPSSATVNGRAAALSPSGELVVREVPADVVLEKAAP